MIQGAFFYEIQNNSILNYRNMSETSIASARASVMIYDDVNKKWVPSGSSAGVSKVHIFQHNFNNTFRVVGRKLQDHEVVINCLIARTLKYNQATSTFHQWRDSKQVYGLNFSSRDDADAFAKAMNFAVETLGSIKPLCQPPAAPINTNTSSTNVTMNGQPSIPQTNGQFTGQYDEDMGYRTMTKEDMVIIQERRMSQQSQVPSSPGSMSTVSTISVSPQGPPGHQRTSSAPPAPQPPPLILSTPPLSQPSPAPPPPTVLTIPAPPCPPPLPFNNLLKSSESPEQGSLAAQLQTARLRRSNRQSAENSGSSTSSSGSNYGTLGRGQGGMASMMDEMAKTLARRRAAVEKKEPENTSEENTLNDKKSWNNKNNSNGCESPKPVRKQFMTSSEELTTKVNGEVMPISGDLENLKQEIIREMKKEVTRMKQEIIDAIKIELGRR
ncbi:hypothetical protein PGB90_005978 [Kerria lacca]